MEGLAVDSCANTKAKSTPVLNLAGEAAVTNQRCTGETRYHRCSIRGKWR